MRLAVVLVLVLAGSLEQAAAAPTSTPFRDYVQTQWTHYDGAPLGLVRRILQTSDGYLWVVTTDDFLRFDGMRFVRPATPCTQPIGTMALATDGGLWAICGERLIRRDTSGRFAEIPQKVPPSSGLLFVDRDGRVWILGGTTRYLERDGAGGRTFATNILAAAQDSEGTIWGSDGENVYHLYPDRIEPIASPGFFCATTTRSGGIFAVTREGAVWRLQKGAPPALITKYALAVLRYCMAEAPDGSLWLSARRDGVVVFREGRIEARETATFNRMATDVLVDREGAIWVSSSAGLFRFRKPAVQTIQLSPEQGQPWFVFADSRGGLWTGTSRNVRHRHLATGAEQSISPDSPYAAVGEDERGTIWLSSEKDIGYVANGTYVAVSDISGRPIASVLAFSQDRLGYLWALATGVGVYQVTPGPPRLVVAAPRADIRFLITENSGIWTGLYDGGVEQHFDGRITPYPRPNPMVGNAHPRALVQDGDSIWVASLGGLDRLRNGRWTRWTREHGLPGNGRVNEIVADRSGYFWMMTGGGLLRMPRAQLDATPDGAPRRLSFARIGALDGVVPHPGTLKWSPAVTSDRSGRLYFTTSDSILSIDPAAMSDSSMIPPIVLESVNADNQPVDHTAVNRFVQPSLLQFQYTALNIHSSETARFRYRLDNYDADWIEAGNARQVTYGALRPGEYRFQVIGAGAEGVWNEIGASFAFQIVPVFWRTWWFQASIVAFGLVLAGGLYRLRIRQLTKQFNAGLEARVGERTRIARELHDTLLQSFQGVVIHFQAATNLLPARPDDAKRRLEGTLDEAVRAITEGRDAVQAMRDSAAASDDLPQALSALADQLTPDGVPPDVAAICVNVEGSPRSLHPIVRDDVYRIAAEAMRNAVRHAQGRTIQVDVHYDPECLRLRIRDDGKGIDAAILASRGVSGHWGLPGMRERAELIGGTLNVRSRLGSGTEVELGLPASKAYAAPPARRRYFSRP